MVNFDGVCADLERIGCRRNELCLIVAAVTQEVIACDLGDELDGLGVDSSSVVHDLVGVAHDVTERRAGTADQRRAAGVVRAAGLCSCQRRGDAVPHDLYADLEVGADYAADLLSHNRHAGDADVVGVVSVGVNTVDGLDDAAIRTAVFECSSVLDGFLKRAFKIAARVEGRVRHRQQMDTTDNQLFAVRKICNHTGVPPCSAAGDQNEALISLVRRIEPPNGK